MSEPEGARRGNAQPPDFVNDQLTLFQPGGQIVPTTLLLAPPRIFKISYGPDSDQRGVQQSTAASDYNFHLIEWSLIALCYIL